MEIIDELKDAFGISRKKARRHAETKSTPMRRKKPWKDRTTYGGVPGQRGRVWKTKQRSGKK